ncbi:MAG: protein-L-isoaspartate(D-aspartate) O-methyltransferase [Pseudomonadota bacterium]
MISTIFAGVMANNFTAAQDILLAEIARDFRATAHFTGITAMSPKVESAMRAVDRHEFVSKRQQRSAYRNHPLSIGHGQTISQPFIVALMTELLALEPGDRVLEIGTGSGYQAAVLAELASEIFSVEIVDALGRQARQRLEDLGYANVKVKIGDGNHGWSDYAPFDAIIVTAGGRIPTALLAQLKTGGRMVIPENVSANNQELMLLTKSADGEITKDSKLPVRFVPITGEN